MKIVNHPQGSDAWLAHRRTTRNASDAPAMMGASPYVSRSALVKRYATGVEPEIDAETQARFDRGHAVEPVLRAMAEKIIDEDLYPITATSDDGYLGASLDGVNLDETIIFEAKQSNAEKLACIEREEIPQQDYWQIVQQFAVCESAVTCLYAVGDGSKDGSAVLTILRSDVQRDIPKLLAGWQQFDTDVAAYVSEPQAAPAPAGRAPDQLPSLSIQVTGMVTASNLADFKAQALAVLGGINRDLQTDEDFANAEQTVKWCKGVEDRLEATKQQVLGQTADIDAVFRTMDEVSAETRRIRLELDKLVSKEKENRRLEIVTRGREAYAAHVEALKAETKGVWLQLVAPDFAGAIKGKRTLSSMKDAVDTVLAQAKIAASESAAHIRAALALLSEETAEHKHLFPDYLSFIDKPLEDIRALVRGRIAEHQQREAARMEQERERIRQEEAAKAQAEAERQAVAEAQRQHDAQLTMSIDAERAQEAEARSRGTPVPPATPFASEWSAPAPSNPSARIKLGDINAAIAPLSITADGLRSLGFEPVGSAGAAKLYAAADFEHIRAALVNCIESAHFDNSVRAAA